MHWTQEGILGRKMFGFTEWMDLVGWQREEEKGGRIVVGTGKVEEGEGGGKFESDHSTGNKQNRMAIGGREEGEDDTGMG